MNLSVSVKWKKVRIKSILQKGKKGNKRHPDCCHDTFVQLTISLYAILHIKTISNAAAVDKHPASTVGNIFFSPLFFTNGSHTTCF